MIKWSLDKTSTAVDDITLLYMCFKFIIRSEMYVSPVYRSKEDIIAKKCSDLNASSGLLKRDMRTHNFFISNNLTCKPG